MLEWSRGVYGAEEDIIDGIREDFLTVNLPYLYYSVCSAYCRFCALIKVDWYFPFKVDNVCSIVELTFSIFFGDCFFLIHEI